MKNIRKFIALALVIGTCVLPGCSSKPSGNGGASTPAASGSNGGASTTAPGVTWPEDDVEILIGFAPGAGSDMLARAMAQYIDLDGHAMICTNMTGSSGTIALMECYNKEPNGLNMTLCLPENYASFIIRELIPADLFDNLELIAAPVFDPYCVCVSSKSSFETLDDLVEYSKENTVEMAIAGTGIMKWYSYAIFDASGMENFKCLSYADGNESRTAILGGHTDATLINVSEAKAYYDSGDFRILAIGAEERMSFMPDIPTFTEQGIDFVAGQHRGFAVSPGTPEEIIEEIEARIYAVYENPEFIDYMNNTLGFNTKWTGREDYKELASGLVEYLNGWKAVADEFEAKSSAS